MLIEDSFGGLGLMVVWSLWCVLWRESSKDMLRNAGHGVKFPEDRKYVHGPFKLGCAWQSYTV
jgi:hypothetical protein